MSAQELNYDELKKMNKAQFFLLFKKPAIWKKASGVIFITKYKFTNGKLPLVAIPYRKYTEAVKVFKEQAKKDFSAKFILLSSLEYAKQEDGNMEVQVTAVKGGISNEFLQKEGEKLFSKLKMGFTIVGLTQQPVVEDESEENIASVKRLKEIEKINQKVTHLEKQIGKMSTQDLVNVLNEDLVELEVYEATARKDEKIDADELQTIRLLKKKIERFKDKLQNHVTPKQKEKVIARTVRMTENIDRILEKVNAAIGDV